MKRIIKSRLGTIYSQYLLYLTHHHFDRDGEKASCHSSLTIHSWKPHHDEVCETCNMVDARKKGGRPPKSKKRKITGCPSHLIEHIRSVAGPRYGYSSPLTPSSFLLGVSPLSLDDLMCHSCQNILDEPVELPCKHLLCHLCCCDLQSNFNCPQCNQTHELVASSFQSPTPFVDKLLRKLVVR